MTIFKHRGYTLSQFFLAVILPDNLAPLPVSPRGDEKTGGSTVAFENFVSLGDVRKVLLGDAGDRVVEGLPAEDFESFAGRSDVACPSVSRVGGAYHGPVAVPDLAFEPRLIHPAFETVPTVVRRATPPQARQVEDCEAGYGRAKLSDRWWVIGMGLAATAVLLSGTAVDFISREAVRRSNSGVEPVSRVFPADTEKAEQAVEARPAAIAASARLGGN